MESWTQDYQHLIQLSFAKIISSKNVKGGASLHKSLMVLHVLQKAREEQKCRSPCSSNSSDEEFDQEMQSSEEDVDDSPSSLPDIDTSTSAAASEPSNVTTTVFSSGGSCLLGKRPMLSSPFDASAIVVDSSDYVADDSSSSTTSVDAYLSTSNLWQPKRSCLSANAIIATNSSCQSFEMCCSS